MPKITNTKYMCAICDEEHSKKSVNNNHIKSEKHLKNCEILKLKLQMKEKDDILIDYPEFLDDVEKFDNKSDLINTIIKDKSSIKIQTVINNNSDDHNDNNYDLNIGIDSREEIKNRIHSLHNFLRNNGAGYGMNALKMFSLFYGLKKIEDEENDFKIFDKTGLPNECKFSEIKKDFNENSELAFNNLTKEDGIMSNIYDNENVCKLLECNISRQIKPNTLKYLINQVDELYKIEKSQNFQLAGKIYEYFIGRDQTAISELGAYFTDRHITTYIYDEVLKPTLDEHGHVREMIDMFGGSGGFTLGYMDYLIKNFNINWGENQNRISHYDMNADVVQYAMLEYLCLTGEFASEDLFNDFNSFTKDFNKKYYYVITNPPYGGDSVEKTVNIQIMDLIKKEITQYFKDNYKIKTMANLKKIKITENEKNKVKQFNYYSKEIKKFEKEEAAKNVSLITSSDQLQNYGKELVKYGLKPENCKDKESVSLLLMMVVLEEGGTAVGVLKEGVFFAPKYAHVRKALIENFKVEKIVSVDANQFENTTTKTSIIKFSNTGKTERIEFFDLTVDKEENFELKENENGTYEIDKIKDRITGVKENYLTFASYEDIVENDYTLNHKKYNIKEIVPGDDFKLSELGDITEFLPKSKRLASFATEDGEYRYYSSGQNILKCNEADYNQKSIIIGHSGDGCIFLDNKYSTLLTNHILTAENLYLEYIYYYLKSDYNRFYKESYDGSTVQNTSDNNIKKFKIPIPKSEDKIIEWVDKISEPYNKVIENKNKLKELEEQVKQDIQNMIDSNDCDDVKLGNLCDIRSGKPINKENRKGTKYPYYASNGIVGFVNNYLFNGKFIICAQDGSIGATYLVNNKFYASNHVWILDLKCNNLINFVYNILKYFTDYKKLTGGSVIPKLNKDMLSNLKIKIPKDKSLIDSLNPTFNEIDSLNEEIPKQEKLYQQYLNELKSEAIKED
uniref:Type I restriction modification DNA specificity domain-containing protein n=1 Tax=viral metagenome TaxID=1070528 RepID=A0A6C0CYD7_9ZZZZ